MLLELPPELLAHVLTDLAHSITFSSFSPALGAHPDTQILRSCRYLRERATPLILQHATYYISARTFSKICDQYHNLLPAAAVVAAAKKHGIQHIMIPPVVADTFLDGPPQGSEQLFFGGSHLPKMMSLAQQLQTLEIDHRMCGCRSNSLIDRMHAQDCTSLIFGPHSRDHLEFAVRGFANDYYQSYMQKCLLTHRKELARYFAWVRTSGIDVRVKMVVMRGRFEECCLWVGRNGIQVVRDEGKCVDEAMEWPRLSNSDGHWLLDEHGFPSVDMMLSLVLMSTDATHA